MSIFDLLAEKLNYVAAGELVGVDPTTVKRWTDEGIDGRKLPHLQIGRRQFVLRRDLEAFLTAGYAGNLESAVAAS